MTRVVVVGAGFGGLNAVKTLRRAPVQIEVVDRRNFHLFQPLLYQVATAALNPSDIAYPIRSVFRGQDNVAAVIMDEVVDIDLGEREVKLADGGSLSYDYLVVASGATHSYFGRDDWAEHAPGLKTLEDAVRMRRHILAAFEEAERHPDRAEELLTFVVIGPARPVSVGRCLIEIAVHSMSRSSDASTPPGRGSCWSRHRPGPAALSGATVRQRPQAARRNGCRGADGGDGLRGGRQGCHARQRTADRGRHRPLGRRSAGVFARSQAGCEPRPGGEGRSRARPVHSRSSGGVRRGRPRPGAGRPRRGAGRDPDGSSRRPEHHCRHRRPGRQPFRYRNKGSLATIGRAAVADFGWLRFGVLRLGRLAGGPIWYLIGFRTGSRLPELGVELRHVPPQTGSPQLPR